MRGRAVVVSQWTDLVSGGPDWLAGQVVLTGETKDRPVENEAPRLARSGKEQTTAPPQPLSKYQVGLFFVRHGPTVHPLTATGIPDVSAGA